MAKQGRNVCAAGEHAIGRRRSHAQFGVDLGERSSTLLFRTVSVPAVALGHARRGRATCAATLGGACPLPRPRRVTLRVQADEHDVLDDSPEFHFWKGTVVEHVEHASSFAGSREEAGFLGMTLSPAQILLPGEDVYPCAAHEGIRHPDARRGRPR